MINEMLEHSVKSFLKRHRLSNVFVYYLPTKQCKCKMKQLLKAGKWLCLVFFFFFPPVHTMVVAISDSVMKHYIKYNYVY